MTDNNITVPPRPQPPGDWPILQQINTQWMLPDGLNHMKGRNGRTPIAIVYHITESDSIGGVDQWFNDPQAQVSAHFALDRDGSVHQYVSTDDTAWSNGNLTNPYGAWIPWLKEIIDSNQAGNYVNPNWRTISIEHVGHATTGVTEAQVRATIDLSRFVIAKWGIPVYPGIAPSEARKYLTRHSDFDSVTRANCPGSLFPLARIINTLCGVPGK